MGAQYIVGIVFFLKDSSLQSCQVFGIVPPPPPTSWSCQRSHFGNIFLLERLYKVSFREVNDVLKNCTFERLTLSEGQWRTWGPTKVSAMLLWASDQRRGREAAEIYEAQGLLQEPQCSQKLAGGTLAIQGWIWSAYTPVNTMGKPKISCTSGGLHAKVIFDFFPLLIFILYSTLCSGFPWLPQKLCTCCKFYLFGEMDMSLCHRRAITETQILSILLTDPLPYRSLLTILSLSSHCPLFNAYLIQFISNAEQYHYLFLLLTQALRVSAAPSGSQEREYLSLYKENNSLEGVTYGACFSNENLFLIPHPNLKI